MDLLALVWLSVYSDLKGESKAPKNCMVLVGHNPDAKSVPFFLDARPRQYIIILVLQLFHDFPLSRKETSVPV